MFERAFTEQRLLDAWGEVREAALADGDGGPEVDRFEAAVARHVSELARALASELARAFIDGKIANMRVALLRAGRRVLDPVTAGVAETLAITRLVLQDASSRAELRRE